MICKCFDKKISGSGIKNENISKNKLAKELHELIIRNSKKRKVQSQFVYNLLGAELADTQLISKFTKVFKFFICVIDIYGKYAWVILLKDKKVIAITNAFQKVLYNRKPNKIWVDKGSEF